MTSRKLRALGFSSAGEFLTADEVGGRIKFHQLELLPTTGGLCSASSASRSAMRT